MNGHSRAQSAPVAAGSWSLAAAPEGVWSPIAAGIIILAVGAASLAAKQPWLIPSLAGTALLQAHAPGDPSARPYNVAVGHILAVLAAALAIALMGAGDAPGALSAKASTIHVTRVWASAFAVLLAMTGQHLLRAFHPPAAVTALLISLGFYRPTLKVAGAVLAGVAITLLVGEALRRLRTTDRRWHPW